MNKRSPAARRRAPDYAATALEQMKDYCAVRPGSPSALRQPQLFFRGELWIALLGRNLEEGIVGIGPTVAAALRAFDAQYLAGLCPPNEKMSPSMKSLQSYAVQLPGRPSAESAHRAARRGFKARNFWNSVGVKQNG